MELQSKKKIFLIGMPGSGKTTIGRMLAKELKFRFIDTDMVIQDIFQLSINEIFNRYGEGAFRETELRVINELIQESNLVVATGGGLVVHKELIEELNKNGITIYLKVAPEMLYNRIMNDNTRPLLNKNQSDEGKFDKINKLYQQRKCKYEKATLIVNANKSENNVLKSILEKIM